MSIFKTRKEEIEKKESHFKNSVMKFNNFLKVFSKGLFLNILSKRNHFNKISKGK
jgi:hypothetical protein